MARHEGHRAEEPSEFSTKIGRGGFHVICVYQITALPDRVDRLGQPTIVRSTPEAGIIGGPNGTVMTSASRESLANAIAAQEAKLAALDREREDVRLELERLRRELITLDSAATTRIALASSSPILLTERKDHLEYFEAQLRPAARNIVVLQGGMGAKQRRKTTERIAGIPPSEERLVLATGRYIGEGFDDARLDTLFLALPVSWKGTLIQYAGRLHRMHEGKREVRIFDYVDRMVPMLARMFEKRLRGYGAIGYAQADVPSEYEGPWNGPVVEYDGEPIQKSDDWS
jgi:hypothetical protein